MRIVTGRLHLMINNNTEEIIDENEMDKCLLKSNKYKLIRAAGGGTVHMSK